MTSARWAAARASATVAVVLVALASCLCLLPAAAQASTTTWVATQGTTGFVVTVWGANETLGRYEIYRSSGETAASSTTTAAAGSLVGSFVPGMSVWATYGSYFVPFTDTGLAPSTTYTYWVFGFDMGGNVVECTPYVVRTGAAVWGQVQDASGTPLPGSTVTLWGYDYTAWYPIATTTSSADGTYGFPTNVSGFQFCQISASDPISGGPTTFLGGGFYPQDSGWLRQIPSNAIIKLNRTCAHIRGKIVSAKDGSAVPSATITLYRSTPTYDTNGNLVYYQDLTVGTLTTGADGTYAGVVAPGKYTYDETSYAFLKKSISTAVDIGAGADVNLGTLAVTPAWDTPPVFVDPYEGDDSTSTAVALPSDGSAFTGYCDPSGADWMSFQAKANKMYSVTVSTKGYGCWGRVGVYLADGSQPWQYPAPGGYTFYGSMPSTQSATIWVSSDTTQTLYVGYDLMNASQTYASLNYPPGALVPYHVSFAESDEPVVRGRVTDPKTGDPVSGATVDLWCNPVTYINGKFPASADLFEATKTADDGTYQFTTPFPCTACVYFDDPSGGRIGEYYPHSATWGPSGANPGHALLNLQPNTVLENVDGYVRQPGRLEIRAVRADTGEPVPGARFALETWVTDLQWQEFWNLPDTGSDGISRYTSLDPRKNYLAIRWDAPGALPSPAYDAGYRFVDFVGDPNMAVADGTTYTITARYALAPSDVAVAPPSGAVLAGSTFKVNGAVSWLGSGVASQSVDVDASTNGTDWHLVGSATTRADGSFSVDASAATSSAFRARFAGSHDAGAGVSQAVSMTVAAFGAESYRAARNATLTVAAPGVLGSDRVVNDPSITATVSASPQHGSLSLSADGGFRYVPAHSFEGTDTFTYSAWDGQGYSAPSTVTLLVASDSTPPSTAASGVPAGWSSRDVTVTLTSTDGTYTVASTRFVAGGTTQTYNGPFVISAEGTTAIKYWSVNSEGNSETTKTALVRIDKTAPALSIAGLGTQDGVGRASALVDDPISGVGLVEVLADGADWTASRTAVFSTPGHHTVAFRATDLAGNSSVASGTLVVRGATAWLASSVTSAAPPVTMPTTVTAQLCDWRGDTLSGADAGVSVQFSSDARVWASVPATITSLGGGRYAAQIIPKSGAYRLYYSGDPDNEPSGSSASVVRVVLNRSSWTPATFVGASGTSRSVALGAEIAVESSLTAETLGPLSGAAVRLQSSADGVAFQDLAAAVSAWGGGGYRAGLSAGPSSWIRFAFAGNELVAASYSQPVRVITSAKLSPPAGRVRGSGTHATLTISGSILPVRSASSRGAYATITRYSKGRWITFRRSWVPVSSSGALRLSVAVSKGRYRVAWSAPSTADHSAAGPTSPRTVVVK